jgi:hypothetical protein
LRVSRTRPKSSRELPLSPSQTSIIRAKGNAPLIAVRITNQMMVAIDLTFRIPHEQVREEYH